MAKEAETMKKTDNATRKRAAAKTPEAAPIPAQTMQDFAEAVAEAVARKLLEIGPTLARIAQADTVHSVQQPETVFTHAIAEGEIARRLLAKGKDRGGAD